ncbi:MAG: acyl carrier protein [Candidatus Omnitrophota bacterium]
MDTKAKIKDTLITLLRIRPEELKDDIALESGLGVDSTEMVEAVIALEKAFNIKLSAKEVTKFSSVNDIEKIINLKLGA